MADIRDGQINTANQNPSILSNLVGQTPAGGSPITPPANNPQMQQAGQIAQNLSSNLYGGGFVGGAEGQSDSMAQELFNYDKMLEGNYSALPSPDWYVPNPADEGAALAAVAGQTAQNIGTTQGVVNTTERAYQTAVGSVLDRFTQFLELQDRQREREEMLKLEREKLQLEREKMGSSGSGSGIPAMMQALAASGGKLDQNTLIAALASAKSPQEASLMMDLFDRFGSSGGMTTDQDAIFQVMSQGGGEMLSAVPTEQRGAFARYILTKGQVPKQLSDNEKKMAFQINTLKDAYDTLATEFGQIPGYSRGVLGGRVGGVTKSLGMNPELTDYDSMRQGTIVGLARVLSGGSEEPNAIAVKQAEEMLPRATDTRQEAYGKFSRLADIISQRLAMLGGTAQPSAPGGSSFIPVANQKPSSMLGLGRPPLSSFNL